MVKGSENYAFAGIPWKYLNRDEPERISFKSKPNSAYYGTDISSSPYIMINPDQLSSKGWNEVSLTAFSEDFSLALRCAHSRTKIEPKLVAVYPWTEQGNFYTFYVNQQCYLFMESGEMYHLSKEAEKIGTLGKNLVDYSILHDQDQDKLFVIAKKHLEEQIPFSALLEKYGEEIKLKSK
ncbi:MAG: hypothetical protein HC892_12000 [Saprospiraceae bacterium]|nr:hypothetical protein [Saprospiraceae bacterium]